MPTERCPACGHLPGEGDRPTPEMQVMGWAVTLSQASTSSAEQPADVATRLRTIYQAVDLLLKGDGPPGGEG
jgi:hypothetical protein